MICNLAEGLELVSGLFSGMTCIGSSKKWSADLDSTLPRCSAVPSDCNLAGGFGVGWPV